MLTIFQNTIIIYSGMSSHPDKYLIMPCDRGHITSNPDLKSGTTHGGKF